LDQTGGGNIMAINMMCINSECKYYWEDCCTRNLEEKRIVINNYGQCETFEVGKSDYYENDLDQTQPVKKG
jgi:CTP:phosphocholine cytidylyltransferase-like protein